MPGARRQGTPVRDHRTGFAKPIPEAELVQGQEHAKPRAKARRAPVASKIPERSDQGASLDMASGSGSTHT